jgi:type II secretory pathway pseudopilin PulG
MRAYTDAPRGGFVLMEAVIALAIISLIAVALLGATAAQVRTADKGALLLVAQSLADERMATLRALGWFELSELPDSLAAGTFPPPFHEYAWQAEVAPVDGELDLFSLGVRVTVADEAYTMRSLIHEPQVAEAAAAGAVNFAPNPVQVPTSPGSRP